MPKVSVIIPIYNVAKFIGRCAETLLQQSLGDVEYIFVDDASPDNSIEILKSVIAKHPERAADVKIVSHPHNKGLPAARNSGLAIARGEYIFHCDGDDYVETDMLEKMYQATGGGKADIVWSDWYLTFDHKERYMTEPCHSTSLDAVKAMLGGTMKYNVWNKLVRRDLYLHHNILFPEGYGMGEDMTMIMLFSYAEKVTYVHEAFYHYVKMNTGAFSQTYSERHLTDLRHNVERIQDFIRARYGDALELELSLMKLDIKKPFLITADSSKYRLWKQWYPESNRFAMKNKAMSLRIRIVQWLAWKGQFWLVRLHYILVYRILSRFL